MPEDKLFDDEFQKLYVKTMNVDSVKEASAISDLGKALSSPVRLEILRLLNQRPMTISQIAKLFSIPMSSAAFHMDVLLTAGLVSISFSTQKKGHIKWFSYSRSKAVVLKLRPFVGPNLDTSYFFERQIGIGDYCDCNLSFYSGFADEEKVLMSREPDKAFVKDKEKAQILWNGDCGYLEYAIENSYAKNQELQSIEVSLELCSEALGYNENYPSDITFEINGKELFCWTCPGDCGDRYGNYTPSWWYKESTKYGFLCNICVRDNGAYFNGELKNKNATLDSLNLSQGNKTTVCIKVKEDAVHKGGFNLFGEKFGDYPQAIIFKAFKKQ